jgi:retron-type reverse transcriptase
MKKWNEKYYAKFKKHSLGNQVWDKRNLENAWKQVKANRGSAGVDGVTIEEFERNSQQNLSEIERQLKENCYVPQPVKRVLIPKDNGKMRPLGVPAIKDRVVQQALKNVLEPIFENIFLPQSHGYRPGTDAHAAVRKAEAFINSGYHWLVDADIEGFFDHVDHKILMDLVCEQVSDGRVLSWIESILKSGILNEGVFEESTEGTPQGGNLSPLLANIYLNHFDRRMGDYGYLLLRYADDIIIFCKIVHGNVTGVEFLGFHFNGRWKKPKHKAIEKFKSEIKNRTRRQQPISFETLIKLLNPIIRGWWNYFKGCTKKWVFKDLDEYIMERLRGFKAKSRSNKVLWYSLPKSELAQMGLIFLYRSIFI